MKTYKEHYEKCRKESAFSTEENKIQNLSLKLNLFEGKIPQDLIKTIDSKIVKKLETNKDVTETTWTRHISNWEDIPEIEELCQIVMPLIEKEHFGCNLKVEHLHIYENKKDIPLEASWQWHYDDCPHEFVKFAIYTNNVTKESGCMQVLIDEEGIVPTIESFRTSPQSKKGNPPPVFHRSRIPEHFVENVLNLGGSIKNLTGQAGTHFLFTPNVIHRGTPPEETAESRRAVFFFIRPSLMKQQNYSQAALPEYVKINVKRYELD